MLHAKVQCQVLRERFQRNGWPANRDMLEHRVPFEPVEEASFISHAKEPVLNKRRSLDEPLINRKRYGINVFSERRISAKH